MGTSRIQALRTARNQTWHQANDFLSRINERSDPRMNAEERARWATMNAELDRLQEDIDDQESRIQLESERSAIREADGITYGSAGVRHNDTELRNFLRGQSPGCEMVVPVDRAVYERKLMRDGATALEARALAWDTGSVASAVPTSMARSLYEYLESAAAVLKTGLTRITTDSGEPMLFPKLSSHAIATQVAGQGTTIAGTDPTFANMQLGAYKYAELIVVSNEVIQDVAFDIAEFLGRDIGRAIGRKIGADLITGNGSTQPQGIAVAAASCGSVTTGGSLIGPTYESLVDLQFSLGDEYRASRSAAFMFRDSTMASIRKLRADGTSGAPLWQPSMVAGAPDTLLGHAVYTDPSIASMASNARIGYFGAFESYYFRSVGNVMIERSDHRYFDTDQVGIRGRWRVDAGLIDDGALKSLLQNV